MVAIIYLLLDSPDQKFLFSMATAYAGLILLAVSLLLGPLNLIRNKANPVSSYLRRDIGIWAAIVSIIHVIFGLQVHMGGRIWTYFFHDMEPGQGYAVRLDAFGFANHSGLVATLICIVLMAVSNNASLKKLGQHRWKSIQRLNYLLFPLVIGHGFIYQVLEKRQLPFVAVVGLIFVVVLVMQWKGFKIRSS